MPTVLLTGGAGYIATHTALELLDHGHDVVLLDDFSNSHPKAVERVRELAKCEIPLVRADAADPDALVAAMTEHGVDSVIHFAGLKAVGESVAEPLKYYRVNLGTLIRVLEAMATCNVHDIVFSSSATVYEQPGEGLSEEDSSGLDLANPYGRTKIMCEHILADAAAADPDLRVGVLRYFNPIGAHPSGLIGEDPVGVPNNLMPFIAQVASGLRDRVRIFGSDYPTPDGTGIRDYIHVMDLAEAHVSMLEHLEAGVATVNIGTGRGTSVREAIAAFEVAVGHPLPVEVVDRRPGDAAVTTADPSYAHQRIDWQARRTVEDACRDAWNWQRSNPRGYREAHGER